MGSDTKEFGLKAKVFIMFKGLTRPYILYLHVEENTVLFSYLDSNTMTLWT